MYIHILETYFKEKRKIIFEKLRDGRDVQWEFSLSILYLSLKNNLRCCTTNCILIEMLNQILVESAIH